jgi:hypothetical protein
MPGWLAEALAGHISTYPPLPPRESLSPVWADCFYRRECKPLNRNYFNTDVWPPALDEVQIPRSR